MLITLQGADVLEIMINKIPSMFRRPIGSAPDDLRTAQRMSPFSIRDADCAAVAQAVALVTDDWTVSVSRPFDDEINLIIGPRDVHDDVAPNFVIYHEIDGIHVDRVQWNSCETIGVYFDMSRAIQAMIVHLDRAARMRTAICLTDRQPI